MSSSTAKTALLVTAFALLASQAWAINKCTGADGKITFQDAPCAGKGEVITVKPAAGKGPNMLSPLPAGSASAASLAGAQTDTQRREAMVAASVAERRRLEFEQRLVPEALNAITRQRAACDQEIKTLRDSKAFTTNNLAGATLDASISAEMTAVATRCNTHNAEVRADYDTALKECKLLGGCK